MMYVYSLFSDSAIYHHLFLFCERRSGEIVISVWNSIMIIILVFIPGEVEEVLRPVHFVVEVLGVVNHQAEFHMFAEVDTVEVVIPNSAI